MESVDSALTEEKITEFVPTSHEEKLELTRKEVIEFQQISNKDNSEVTVTEKETTIFLPTCDKENMDISTTAVANNYQYKYLYQKTVFDLLILMYLGMLASIIGTTLVHLEILLNATTLQISASVILFAVGYLLGGFLCGLLFDRFNWEILFIVFTGIMSLSTGLAALSRTMIEFICLWTIVNISMGYIDAASQSYCVIMWQDQKWKNPIMQSLHVIWSGGAAFGPFIIRPFLVTLNSDTSELSLNVTSVNTTVSPFMNASDIKLAASMVTEYNLFVSTFLQSSLPDVSLVRYAYIALASIGIIPLACFCYAFYFLSPNRHLRRKKKKPDEKQGDQIQLSNKRKRSVTITLLTLLSFYFCFYLWIESIPGTLLGLFVVRGLRWDATSVSTLMTTFWGSHCLGRIVSIPVSLVFKPAVMICLNVSITLIAFCLLLIGSLYNDVLVWISVAAAGFGMASAFANGILYSSEHMQFTGVTASVITVASSVGELTGRPFAGFLFETYGHMTFVYILIGASLLLGICFAVLVISVKIFERQGKLGQLVTVNNEKLIENTKSPDSL